MRNLDRRPLLIVVGWLLAVVIAVVVGVVGIGLVGAGLTSRQGAPVSEDQVERELRSLPSPSAGSASSGSPSPGASSPGPSSAGASGPTSAPGIQGLSFPTRGGTVVADCTRIISMSPAQGFAVHEQDDDEGEFRSVSDPRDRVEFELECAGGVPRLVPPTED